MKALGPNCSTFSKPDFNRDLQPVTAEPAATLLDVEGKRRGANLPEISSGQIPIVEGGIDQLHDTIGGVTVDQDDIIARSRPDEASTHWGWLRVIRRQVTGHARGNDARRGRRGWQLSEFHRIALEGRIELVEIVHQARGLGTLA